MWYSIEPILACELQLPIASWGQQLKPRIHTFHSRIANIAIIDFWFARKQFHNTQTSSLWIVMDQIQTKLTSSNENRFVRF